MDAPPDAPPRPRFDWTFLGVLVSFVLAGCAALLFQSAWAQQFPAAFGGSALARATAFAAALAGLALGATVAGRVVSRIRRPVLWYAGLELGIALGALAVPVALRFARGISAATLGGGEDLLSTGGPGQVLLFLASAFVVLFVPTTLMGATLPMLTRYAVRRANQIGPRVGLLFAAYTAGAGIGTLSAAFLLLPRLGSASTVLVGVAIDIIVFGIALALARTALPASMGSVPPFGAAALAEQREAGVGDGRVRWLPPLVLTSGAVSLIYGALWMRLLVPLFGAGLHARATVLAALLAGISIGGVAAGLLARNRRISAVGFLLAQLGAAALSLFAFLFLDGLPQGLRDLTEVLQVNAPLARMLIATLVLLPPAVCLGAAFPFATRILAREEIQAGPGVARVTTWNALGAAGGALLAGFVLLPRLGFGGTLTAAVAANLVLATATILLFLPGARITATVGVLGLAILFRPGDPQELLRYSPLDPEGGAQDRVLFSAVGRTATVAMLARQGGFELRADGLPQATIAPLGTPPCGRAAERWLSVLPVLARPDASRMLVIGFGGGLALEALPPSILRLDVIEVEPQVLEANRSVGDLRAVDPLRDRRLSVVMNEARAALALSAGRWDVIVSQPPQPWTAGASHLHTREFLTLCREHLTHDGVLVQGIDAGFFDRELLRSVGATLLDSFPYVRVYRPRGRLLVFLASPAPLEVESELVRSGRPVADHPDFYAALGLYGVSDVAILLALEQEGLEELCAGAQGCTDDANPLAVRAAADLSGRLDSRSLWSLLRDHDPLLDPASAFIRDLGHHLHRPYMARRMMHALPLRGMQSADALADPGQRGLARGLALSSWATADFSAAAESLGEAYRSAPDDPEVRFALVRGALGQGAGDDLEPLAGLLTGSARAVIQGWRRAERADWEGLAALEDELAEAPPVVAWHLESVRLRALWRLRPVTHGARERAAEALALVDAGLALEPDPALLILRLEAATTLDLPSHVLSTAEELARRFGQRLESLPVEPREEIARALRNIGPQLEGLARDAGLDRERARALATRLGELRTVHPSPSAGTPR